MSTEAKNVLTGKIPTLPVVDKTLTRAGYSADAKETGDAIAKNDKKIDKKHEELREELDIERKRIDESRGLIDQIANDQIPKEYLEAAVDKYVEENSAGFATQASLEAIETDLKSDLSYLHDDVNDLMGGYMEARQADFRTGSWVDGEGFDTDTSALRLLNLIPVQIGDVIVIRPNGMRASWQILETPEATTKLKGGTFSADDREFESEYDGYLSVIIKKSDNTVIAKEENTAFVSVGIHRMEAIEEKLENHILEAKVHSPLYKGSVAILDACENVEGWSNPFGGDTPILDTENFLFGTSSVRITAVAQKKIAACNLADNYLVVKLRINSAAEGASLRLFISNSSSFSSYAVYDIHKEFTAKQFSVGEWIEISIPSYGYTEGATSGLDLTNIQYVRFRNSGGAVDFNLQYIGLRKKELNRGIVTFTFDDSYDTQLTGCKILASKGLSGTIFTIVNAIGQAGFMSMDDCYSAVYDYGCELQAHGSTSYTAMTEAELKNHFEATQEWLRTNSFGSGKHLAFPGGVSNPDIVKIARRYFDSCRTIYGAVPLESYPPSEIHRLRAVSAISSASGGVSISKVKSYIDRCERDKSWLILVFHRIGEVTSTMDCSEADLAELADYALSKNVDIKNYSQVFM